MCASSIFRLAKEHKGEHELCQRDMVWFERNMFTRCCGACIFNVAPFLCAAVTFLCRPVFLLIYRRSHFTQTCPGKHLTPVACSVCSFQPMKPLKAAATTSQPVLTVAQIETIFFKVPELYEIHKDFYDGLLPRVQQWSHHQRVGDLFQKLVRLLEHMHIHSWDGLLFVVYCVYSHDSS